MERSTESTGKHIHGDCCGFIEIEREREKEGKKMRESFIEFKPKQQQFVEIIGEDEYNIIVRRNGKLEYWKRVKGVDIFIFIHSFTSEYCNSDVKAFVYEGEK